MKSSYNYHKWLNWSILSISFIIVFFHRFSMTVVAQDVAAALNLTGTDLGNLTSVNFYTYALMQIPVGVLVDYLGPKKISGYGMLMAALGSFIFAISTNIFMAFTARLIVGIGVSVIFVSILKIQSLWFKSSEFSTASGLTSFIGNLGSILATAPLAFIVVLIGWRTSFAIMAAITFGIAILIFKYVVNSPRDKEEAAISIKIDGDGSNNKRFNGLEGLKSVVSNKYTWPNFLILFGFMGPLMAFGGLWGVPFMMEAYSITKELASSHMTALVMGIMLGSPIIGFASDKMGGRKKIIMLVGAVVFTAIWIIILVGFNGRPPLGLMPILLFVMGICVITHILAFTNVKEVNEERFAGMAVSLINFGEFFSASVITYLTSLMLDSNWNGALFEGSRIYSIEAYIKSFYIFIALGLIAILGASFLKENYE